MPNNTPLAERQTWPKLSESLGALFLAPDRCQHCGVLVDDDDASGHAARERWIEHDEWDRPTAVVIVLCAPCAKRLIAPHPRLYAAMPRHKPHPGTMMLCVGCRHRDGLRCAHPGARANGGAGVLVTSPAPLRAFMDGTRNGRRTGWVAEIYPSAPTSCDGRATQPTATDTVPDA